jgi:hypothetical protein
MARCQGFRIKARTEQRWSYQRHPTIMNPYLPDILAVGGLAQLFQAVLDAGAEPGKPLL